MALGAYGRFYDQQFTSNEIIEAGRWLLAEGYIEGNTAWGVAVLDPSSTTKGGRMVDERRSVSDPDLTPAPGGGTRNTLNNYGTLGSAQQAGESSAQFAAATFTAEQRHQVLSVADALGAMRAQFGLNEDVWSLQSRSKVSCGRSLPSRPPHPPWCARHSVGPVRWRRSQPPPHWGRPLVFWCSTRCPHSGLGDLRLQSPTGSARRKGGTRQVGRGSDRFVPPRRRRGSEVASPLVRMPVRWV